jgi:peptidoglycan/xylan/chitin deacetylase (PgdA/CDA1 family)
VNAGSPVAISVVIATHNRRDLLRRCLDELSRQTQDPASFEVVVADDGSTDGTAEMAEGLDLPFELRVLRLNRSGKSAALNAAIDAAAGAACLFLDDDVIASPRLVAEHAAAQGEDPRTLAIGRLVQEPPAGRDGYAHAAAQAWNERYDELAGSEPDWADCYGGNFSAPRAALVEAGGFDLELEAVEDLELGYRLSRAGCVARYLPRAEAVHDDQKPGARVLADQGRFGTVGARLIEMHPDMRPRIFGWFAEPTPREVTLRRLLLALRAPPDLLSRLGVLVPGRGRKRVWFGFVSRYAFWHGARRGMDREEWLRTTRGVAVLMYHAFSEGEEGSRFIIRRRTFARQLRLLKLLRYRVVGVEDLARALRGDQPLPRRAVAITIDDGYRDNVEIAHPVLRRHRAPATIFLVSGRIGGKNDWDAGSTVAGRPLLSADEIRRMMDEGIEFGAHTRTHPSLPETPSEALAVEVGGSRADLEAEVGTPVATFAYPYGRHDERSVAAVADAGYLGAFTTFTRHARAGDDPLLIPRIEIEGTDSTFRFLRKLWFGGS